MDPISIIQNIVSLGLAVKQIADDMSSNKTEGLELAGKVQRLLPLMDKLKSKSAAELNENNLGPSLDRLNHLLDDAGCFLIQISPPKVAKGVISKFVGKVASTAKEAWNSASIVQKFIELNNKFDQILIELSAKEIFKLHGAINDLANRLDTGVGLVGTKVEKVGTNVVEMSKLVHNVQTETNKELSEIKQMVFMILQSGGNMEAFLRSSNQQARDTISNILVNSEQLVNLANISETENEGELASRASTKPSASSASARRNSISALASLLLVDFDHLVWNKADRDTVLGAGSFGSVYKCTYMGQECALKHFECLDKQKPTSRELAKIKREALIMQLASMHYNVIGFKGASVDKGMMIMELAQIPLFDLLHLPDKVELLSLSAQQKLRFHGTRWRVAIMLDIARALTYIHSHKILHRDLKTPNVLLVYDVSRAATSGLPFVAKVSDFGLASAVGMSSSGRSVGTKRAVGAVGSTPYMAPELLDFEGDEVVYTAAVDMYAFGILCNEVLTEKQPWLGLQEVHISRKVADKKERPAPHVPSCPAEEILVSRVIGKSIGGEVCCFHQEPAMRPTAATLCSGEQALLFKALQLCGTEHSSSAKTGPSVVNSTDVLEKITDAMGPSTAGNTGNTEAITKAAEEARVAEVARVAEIARAAKAAKVAETARAAVAARVPQVSDWRCTGCFLLNPDSQRQCTGCHTERPAQVMNVVVAFFLSFFRVVAHTLLYINVFMFTFTVECCEIAAARTSTIAPAECACGGRGAHSASSE